MATVKIGLLGLMALFYIGGGVNHFANPDFYIVMMPPDMPAHGFLVALSGMVEVALGVLVLWPRTRCVAAWTIIAMLVAFLPVHVHMLLNSQLFPDMSVTFLLLRFPMQALLVAWAYWYTLDSAPR